MRQMLFIPISILFSLQVQGQTHRQMRDQTSAANPAGSPDSALGSWPASQRQSAIVNDLAKVSELWAHDWSAKQLDQVIELYAQDAVFLTGTGDRITGRTAIRTALKKALDTNTPYLTVRSLVTEQSGNLGYDSGDYRETITPVSGEGKRESHGNYVIVFKRQPNGKWLIIEHVWTDAPNCP